MILKNFSGGIDLKKILIAFSVIYIFSFIKADDADIVKQEAKKAFDALEAETSTEKWKKAVSQNASKITTIRSSFKQEKVLSFLSQKVVSRGKFVLEKNGSGHRVKWEYTTPFQYVIVIDGQKITMKDESRISKFDMSSSKVFEEINRIMIGSLNGTILSDSGNFIFNITEKGKELNIAMTPKPESAMSGYFKTIEMVMDKKDFTVNTLKMVELSGDTTDLFFTEKTVNGAIPPGEFRVE